jgi:Bacterial Ig-like domain
MALAVQKTVCLSGQTAMSVLNAGQTDQVTFSFNEAVLGFDNADVSVSGGTLSTISQTDATHYTATFTPMAGVIEMATIQVLASGTGTSSWTDLAGNPGTASNTFSITEDTELPTTAPNRTHVQQGHTVAANAAHGVLANDIDPIPGDMLRVSGVDGHGADVGHALTGNYGKLTLRANGSYSYTPSDFSLLQPRGVGVDVFTYTAIDGDEPWTNLCRRDSGKHNSRGHGNLCARWWCGQRQRHGWDWLPDLDRRSERHTHC